MVASDSLKKLVEKFAGDESRSKLNETQVRQQYIDPLFEELGWDVSSRMLRGQKLREVVLEDRVRVSKRLTAPDYGFYLDGTRRFFVEAKKPKEDLQKSRSHAFQVRSYGWSAGLALSILTDFEEFAIYDCRVRPNPDDTTSAAREDYLTFDQYEDRWDDIYDLFSKESVRKGSLDVFMPSKKRGTDPVDKTFLRQIEAWRKLLAEDIYRSDPTMNRYDLNYAVQTTIDRIVFLRVCEDRGTEEYGTLEGITDSGRIYASLMRLFRDADNRYNSGLFHFHREKGRNDPDDFTPNLDISDNVLRDIIGGLYPPKSPYQFSVMPVEILGQTYEQFLGSVITVTDDGVSVEQKPEVRKAGGVYYTPEYIVDYIVEKTIGKLVAGKTPRQVEKMRFVDPACGSGSFLIGAYDFLLDWHLRHYTENNPEKHPKAVYEHRYDVDHENTPPQTQTLQASEWRLTVSEKKRILTNNLYGVDIDPQAVEVTKLSLLLKVLEGEDAQTTQLSLERILPDLEDNIKCGNSLIGHDFYDDQQGRLFDEDEQRRINTFDWQDAFPETFRGKNPGFDAVIGNPPYGAMMSKDELRHLCQKYPESHKFVDSYCLFMIAALRLVKNGNAISYIIPNTFCDLESGVAFRQWILTHNQLELIWQTGWAFKSAVVDTLVTVIRRIQPSSGYQTSIEIAEKAYRRVSSSFTENELYKIDYRNKEEDRNILYKVKPQTFELRSVAAVKAGVKMYEKGKGTPPQTENTLKERPFSQKNECPKGWKPLYRGGDVERYNIRDPKEFVNYGSWLAAPRSAELFSDSKILMRRTDDRLFACVENAGAVCVNSCHVIKIHDSSSNNSSYPYLLGLLNSRLLQRLFEIQNPQMVDKTFAEIKVIYVELLPIRTIDFSDEKDVEKHDRMVSLVEDMLGLHEQLSEAKSPPERSRIQGRISSTDRRIDALVYELYGLTDEEIELVEGAG